jgi:hypothetical protein
VKAKVFALKKKELGEDAAMVEGTLSLHGTPINVLIDLGSTHSYVNKVYTCHMNWVGEELLYDLLVSIPIVEQL